MFGNDIIYKSVGHLGTNYQKDRGIFPYPVGDLQKEHLGYTKCNFLNHFFLNHKNNFLEIL